MAACEGRAVLVAFSFFWREGKSSFRTCFFLVFLSRCCLNKFRTRSSIFFNCALIRSYRLLINRYCQSLKKTIWTKARLKWFFNFYIVPRELIPYVKGNLGMNSISCCWIWLFWMRNTVAAPGLLKGASVCDTTQLWTKTVALVLWLQIANRCISNS